MPNRQTSEFSGMALAVVFLCFCIGVIGRMVPEHFPNLVGPLFQEFGWVRSQIASIFSVCALATGLSGPVAGFLYDRMGPRKLYSIGLCFAGGGLIIAGNASGIWHFYLGLGVAVGFAAACCGNVVNSALVSRWYHAKLPLAIAIVFSSLGAGSFLGLSLSQILITNLGWRSTEIVMGFGILAIIPIILLLPWKKLNSGRPIPSSPNAVTPTVMTIQNMSLKQAMKTPSFWGFATVFFVTANGMYSIVIQSVTYLIEKGMTPVESSFNIGLTGLFIPVGMISCGYFLTRFNNIVVALGTYAFTMIGISFLWMFDGPSHYWAVIGFILFFGLTMGTRGPVVGSFAAKIFRGKNFGVIYGSITTGGGLGAASGSFISGWIYDISQSYEAVFSFSLICLVVGALPFLVIPTIRNQA
ncbi:MFS transporter [Sneathiella aquimaris]|uniref:MFS transporter n=1 Tax=Sneathiella aquimaris TaxID=2599305 RepID=UPI00146C12E4|nr:MFS transporter [Sneathiella aquimaris]